MLLSRHQNAGQTDVLKMWHSSDIGERQNLIHEEIKMGLNSGSVVSLYDGTSYKSVGLPTVIAVRTSNPAICE
jgi:hypothetical protein